MVKHQHRIKAVLISIPTPNGVQKYELDEKGKVIPARLEVLNYVNAPTVAPIVAPPLSPAPAPVQVPQIQVPVPTEPIEPFPIFDDIPTEHALSEEWLGSIDWENPEQETQIEF